MTGVAIAFNADLGSPAYDAAKWRQAAAVVLQYDGRPMGGRQGVRPGGDQLKVSLVGSTITVQPGLAVVDPALTTVQGPYWVAIPTAETHTLDPADATNPRKDIVVLQVRDDDEDSSGFKEAVTEYLPGTASPTPVEAGAPAGAIKLALIDVPAQGGGSPVVTDRRGFCIRGPVQLTYTSSGTFVKADFPWAHAIKVRVQGAGGAGGGAAATASGEVAEGGGGGGGGYGEEIIETHLLAASETVTVGTGGIGVAGASGGNGGNSSFGSFITANGGSGGALGVATSGGTIAAGGGGGGVSGGAWRADGGDGGFGRAMSGQVVFANYGGSSHFAGSQRSSAANSADGSLGSTFGGGGAGARNTNVQSARPGGDGVEGLVIVEVY